MTEETPTTPATRKTYKRELSVILLLYLMYLGYIDNYRILEIMVWPFMLFVGGAFGLESYSRQILPAQPRPRDAER